MRTRKNFLALAVLLFASAAIADGAVDAIMQRNFYATKVATLKSTSTMQLIGSGGETRERKVRGVAKLGGNGVDSNIIVEFDSPADVRGTQFLQIQHTERDDDMWIFLPALHKTRRLVASNKRDSFVGTDFSYGDILPLNPSNFHNRLLREEKLDGSDCYVIESIPNDASYESDLGYARRQLWLRKDNAIEIKIEYYSSDNRLVKTQTTAQHELVDPKTGRWVVKQREMIDWDSGHRTRIAIDSFDTNSPISERAFRVEALGER